MLPLGVPQRLLTGADDPAVPPRFADAYAAAAVEAGDDVTAVTLEGASHFEVIVPGTDVWFEVRSTILSLFGLMSSSDHTPQNRGSPDLHEVGDLVDRGRIKNETGHPPAL
jgi:hypothetical protein